MNMQGTPLYWMVALVACVAMVCTTVAAVMVESLQATVITAAIGAIATPIITHLLGQASALQRTENLSKKLDTQTYEIKTEVQDAAKVVTKDVAKKAEEVASQLVRDKG